MGIRFATAMLMLATISCRLTSEIIPEPGATPGGTTTAALPFAPATSWPDVSVQPGRVLFLPVANRTEYRIHPRWVRAIDETLAAHAAAFLGLEVVSPDVAAALASELGWDPGFVRKSSWSLGEGALSAAARRTGAGIVVFGEISGDRAVAIRAHRAHPDSPRAPWDGLSVALEGPPGRAIYNVPERLLAALDSRIADRTPTRSEPSSEAQSALAGALSALGEGSGASMRRAELALAELSIRHPRWSKPWVGLALVRVARPLAHHGWRRSDLFEEGPAAARHIARRLSLDAQERARLDLVDRYFLDSVLSWEEIERTTAALPGDWSRALAAAAEPTRDRTSFGLDQVVPRGRFARSLLAFAHAGPSQRGQVARAEVAHRDLDEQFGDAVLLRFLFDDAHERGEWREESGWAITSAPAHAIELAETLRLACEGIGVDHSTACQAPIRNWLVARGVDLPELGASFAPLASNAAASFALLEVPDTLLRSHHPVLAADPSFSALWHLPTELAETAAETFRLIDAAGPVASPRYLLVASPRRRAWNLLDQLLEIAYQPAKIARRRGQRDEAQPYFEALSPMARGLRLTRRRELWMRHWLDHREASFEAYGRLVELDPYLGNWNWSWLYAGANKSQYRQVAAWYEQLVPQTPGTQWLTAQAYKRAGDQSARKALLERALVRRPDVTVVMALDYALHDEHADRERRISLLEQALRKYPLDGKLQARISGLYREHGELSKAEDLFTDLLAERNHRSSACRNLASISATRGEPERVRRRLRQCAETIDDRWDSARLWVTLGDYECVHDRFEEAIEAYEKAREKVGGAGWILEHMARAFEYTGDHDRAFALHQLNHDTYAKQDGMSESRFHAIALHLRRGEIAEARGLLPETVEDGDSRTTWVALRFVHRAEQDLDRFAELARATPGEGSLFVYMWSEAWDRGDGDAALAALDLLERTHPDGHDRRFSRGALLLNAGQAEAAVPHFKATVDARPHHAKTRVFLVKALCAAGRPDEAEPHVEHLRTRYPTSFYGDEALAYLLAARGDLEGARDALVASDWYDPLHNIGYFWSAVARRLKFEISLGLYKTNAEDRARLIHRLRAYTGRMIFPRLHVLLARILEADGDARGAAEAMEVAYRLQPSLRDEPNPAYPASAHR